MRGRPDIPRCARRRVFQCLGLAERGFHELRIHVFAALGDFPVRELEHEAIGVSVIAAILGPSVTLRLHDHRSQFRTSRLEARLFRARRSSRRRGVQRLASLNVSIILRRLAAVEPAIIAHYAHAAMAQPLDAVDLFWRPETGGLGIRPGHE
jgi:hypothetical protein